ncbi:MAG: NAD(+)/NADH kinase [Longimonas sp.]|uniref:NAD(+)/NADH kinase n=1 Tax=Longimonas sp. TaxID=2039626 RepID=UPI00334C6D84
MIYGITGNPNKSDVWPLLDHVLGLLKARELSYRLAPDLAKGRAERGASVKEGCVAPSVKDVGRQANIVFSFGGDGTLLRTAHAVSPSDTPLVGINIGRLGFLADVEHDQVARAIDALERGDYRISPRMVMEVDAGERTLGRNWALNECVINRSGAAGLLRIGVTVNGECLNTYWADGIIFSTPTGSTAYSLSAGGPILMPETGVVIITPIAPHTLSVRPIVLPATATITAEVCNPDRPYVFAVDGVSTEFKEPNIPFTVRRAAHSVNLVKLDGTHVFNTLRRKLMWGARSSGSGHARNAESGTPDTKSEGR